MTVRDLVSVMDDTQEVVIITTKYYAEIYRHLAKDIPPTMLAETVHKVFPKLNGKELELAISIE